MVVTRRRKAEMENNWKHLFIASRALGKIQRRRFTRMQKFNEFPMELRQIIVNQMSVKARCRFARCSRLFRSLAKSSENYMYGISLDCRNPRRIIVTAGYRYQPSSLQNFSNDYSISFVTENQKKIMKSSRRNHYYEEVLNTNCDIATDAIHLFEKMVNEHRLSIRSLQVLGEHLVNREFTLLKLKKLNTIFMDTLNPNFVNALHYPLKEVRCYKYPISHATPCIENLSRVQDLLFVPSIIFNYEELKIISAPECEVSVGSMTAQEMFNFINYQLERNDDDCRSMLFINNDETKKQFDKDLLALLNVQVFHEIPRLLKVYKSNLKGKFARVVIMGDSVYFSYPYDGNHVKYKLEELGTRNVISVI